VPQRIHNIPDGEFRMTCPFHTGRGERSKKYSGPDCRFRGKRNFTLTVISTKGSVTVTT